MKKKLRSATISFNIDFKLELLDAFNTMCQQLEKNNKKVLIIYDNVDEFKIILEYLPPIDNSNIKIIITSQYQTWDKFFFCYELKMLNQVMSKEFITIKFGKQKISDDIIKKIDESCRGYILVLNLLISYTINELDNEFDNEPNIEDIIKYYLKNLNENPLKSSNDNYQLNVERAILINFNKVEKECDCIKDNKDIILKMKQIFACSNPDGLCVNSIIKYFKNYNEKSIKHILNKFKRYSIINVSSAYCHHTNYYVPTNQLNLCKHVTIHRITQAVLQDNIDFIDALDNWMQFEESKYDCPILDKFDDSQSIKQEIIKSVGDSNEKWKSFCKSLLHFHYENITQRKFYDILQKKSNEKFDIFLRMFCEVLYFNGNLFVYKNFIQKSVIKKFFENEIVKQNSSIEKWDEGAKKIMELINYQKYYYYSIHNKSKYFY